MAGAVPSGNWFMRLSARIPALLGATVGEKHRGSVASVVIFCMRRL